MSRLTDLDRHLGPLTYGRPSWFPWRAIWSSGDDEDDKGNSLTVYAFGWVARLRLPMILRPYRVKHEAQFWDAATVARMGRNWYYETFRRDYGFCLSDGFFQIFFGAQSDDSLTEKIWSKSLPWMQLRHCAYRLYNLDGSLFWETLENLIFEQQRAMREEVPKAVFIYQDYDGEFGLATTFMEELEWAHGTGWFSWLSIFKSNRVRRSLDISFDREVGPEKGSWKGGIRGTGINLRPEETHEMAFRRYCARDGLSRSGAYKIRYVERATESQK